MNVTTMGRPWREEAAAARTAAADASVAVAEAKAKAARLEDAAEHAAADLARAKSDAETASAKAGFVSLIQIRVFHSRVFHSQHIITCTLCIPHLRLDLSVTSLLPTTPEVCASRMSHTSMPQSIRLQLE